MTFGIWLLRECRGNDLRLETAWRYSRYDNKGDTRSSPREHTSLFLSERSDVRSRGGVSQRGNSVLLSHFISRDPDVALHEGETEFLAGMTASFV